MRRLTRFVGGHDFSRAVSERKSFRPRREPRTLTQNSLINEDEILLRIQIIFARLVDHSHLMQFGRPLISQHPIDFLQLQTSRIVLVPHAQDEAPLASLRVI